jgi:hypothetical protein
VIVSAGSRIKARELPPEISQKTRAMAPDDSLDLKAQERALIERALDRYRGQTVWPRYCCCRGMRVYVSSPTAAINRQVLAYAEYRLFAVLARYAGVRGARVLFQDDADGGVRCSITIDFDATASARARVKGPHAAGTIDRAAERVVQLMRRRLQPEIAAAST